MAFTKKNNIYFVQNVPNTAPNENQTYYYKNIAGKIRNQSLCFHMLSLYSMKKLAQYVFLFILIGIVGYSLYFFSLSPCEKTFEYSIGRFDIQFGVSKEEFKSYIKEAGATWEKTLGRSIFLYDPDASFKINLIYDQRQLATIQKQKTEFGLSAVEDIFKKLDSEFNFFKSEYDKKVYIYEQNLALYKKSRFSNDEIQKLNAQATELNNMTQQLNTLLRERNAKASEYNKVAENYNKKYGGGLEFNQAEYKWNNGVGEINVYQFGNKKDLILALAHELGHALGMDHVENQKSIMYYLTGANTETSLTPSTEDLAELNRVCPDVR